MDTTALSAALRGIATGTGTTATPATESTGLGESAESFGDALSRMVGSAEDSQSQANEAVTGMLDKSVDVHDAMIALHRAEMSLHLTVQVRNKLVQAYQDVMRMPV
jgi:flagellar hook-basal body complex protein FliE